jgi:GT2 family glycosyltransferase
VAALEAQQSAPRFEVVVVDDGSTDNTWAVLSHLSARTSLDLHAVRLTRNGGPAAARNVGWRSTHAEVIAFTDDDCSPEPGWIASLVAGTTAADIAQGRTIPDPDQASNAGPFSRSLSVQSETGFYQTCNIAYRRRVLESTGGFAEEFQFPAGEDTDLAWRAITAGATVTFLDDAVVRHDVRPSNVSVAIRDSWRWQSVALAVSRHPELRRLFPSPYIWRRSHQYAAIALVGIGVAVGARSRSGRLLGAVGLIAPYIRYRTTIDPLPELGPKRRWLSLPASLAVDSAELAACLVGSAKHRTFVL